MDWIKDHCDLIIILCALCVWSFWINERFNKILDKPSYKGREFMIKKDSEEIESIKNIEHLQTYANSLPMLSTNKEKILKCIEFEKEVAEYSLIRDLGKNEYEKLRK